MPAVVADALAVSTRTCGDGPYDQVSPSQPAISDLAFDCASQRMSSVSIPGIPALSHARPPVLSSVEYPVTRTPFSELGLPITPLCKGTPNTPTPKPHNFTPKSGRRPHEPPKFTFVPASAGTSAFDFDNDPSHTPVRPSHSSHLASPSATQTPNPVDTPGDSPPMEHLSILQAPPLHTTTKTHACSKNPTAQPAFSPASASSASSSDLPFCVPRKRAPANHSPNSGRNIDRPHAVYGNLRPGVLVPAGTSKAERCKAEAKHSVSLGGPDKKQRTNLPNISRNVCGALSSKKRKVSSIFGDDDRDDQDDFQDYCLGKDKVALDKPRKPPGRPPKRKINSLPPASLSQPHQSKMPTVSPTPSISSPEKSPSCAASHRSSLVETSTSRGVQQARGKRGRPRKDTIPKPAPPNGGHKSPSASPKKRRGRPNPHKPDDDNDNSDCERSWKGSKRRVSCSLPSDKDESSKVLNHDTPTRRKSQRTVRKVDYKNCDDEDESDGSPKGTRPRNKKCPVEEGGPIGSHGRMLPKLAIVGMRGRKVRKSQELPDRQFSQLTSDELSILRMAFVKYYPTPPSNLQAQARFEQLYGMTMTTKMVQGLWKNELEPWSKRWWDFYGMFNDIAREHKLLKPRDRDPTIKDHEAERWAKQFYKKHGDARVPSLDSTGSESKLKDSTRITETSEEEEMGPSQEPKCSKRRSMGDGGDD